MDVKDQVIADEYALYLGDCCEVVPNLPEESVGFSIFSPPFSDLYAYSDYTEDMGNCSSYQEFFDHFSFLVGALHKVMMPGRVVAVHCMDLPTFKRDGEEIGSRDFPGDVIRCFESAGFIYHSRCCIWKDPLIAATRTKAIGLAHKQLVKDSAMCRMGFADYLLAFRKKGENPKPIEHNKGLQEYFGGKKVPNDLSMFGGVEDQRKNKQSQWIWQRYASPVWDDIRQGNILPYRSGRDKEDEKHICPLQLDVIERGMELWSTEGDVVLTPFMGIGSETYVAVKNGRKAVGVELKESYFRLAVRNTKLAKAKAYRGFDLKV